MYRIRSAQTADIGAVTGIYSDAALNLLVTWDDQAPSKDEMLAKYHGRTEAGYPFLVAEDRANGAIAGFATGGPFHPQTGWRFTLENSIYVSRGYRRQGVGRQLLEALIAQSEQRGFRQMIAGISMPGGDASIAFHKALGFRKVGEFPQTGWKHGQWLSAVYMQRSLGDGAESKPE